MDTDREQKHDIVVRIQQIYARLKELLTGEKHPQTEETEQDVSDLMQQADELQEEKKRREEDGGKS